MRSGAPVVPVGLIGTDEVQPIDKKMPRLFRRVTIRFGEPIDPARYGGRANDHLALRELTDEMMYEIASSPATSTSTRTRRSKAEDIPTDVAHVASLRRRPRRPQPRPS